MLRIASLVMILLMSTGVIIPLAGSSAHGLRQNFIAKKRQFHHRRHSRAWWRRYRARMARIRLQRRREAAIMAHRKLVLTPVMPLPMAKSAPVTAPISVPALVPVTTPVSVPVRVPITVAVTVPISVAPTAPIASPVRIPVTIMGTPPEPVTAPVKVSASVPVTAPAKVRPSVPVTSSVTASAKVSVAAPVVTSTRVPVAPVALSPKVPITVPVVASARVPAAIERPAKVSVKTTVSASAGVSVPAPAAASVSSPASTSAPTAAVKPELPAGWNKLASKTGEVKFRTETAAGAVSGIASLDVVAQSRPNPGYLTAREERRLLSGVAIGDLRRIVIDKMISDGGWVTNDYFRDVAGHRVFIVTAQTPGDGRSPDKSWNFYFTEVNGRIYRLTTNTPQEFSERMASEAESFIASFHAISKPANK